MATQMYKALKMGAWVCWIFAFGYYGVGLGSMVLLGRVTGVPLLSAWYGFTIGLATVVSIYVWKWKGLDLDSVVEKLY